MQERVFVEKAAHEGDLLAWVTSEGYWVANLGDKPSKATLNQFAKLTERFVGTSKFIDEEKFVGELVASARATGSAARAATFLKMFKVAGVVGLGIGLGFVFNDIQQHKYLAAVLDTAELLPSVGILAMIYRSNIEAGVRSLRDIKQSGLWFEGLPDEHGRPQVVIDPMGLR